MICCFILGHKVGICDLESQEERMVSSDDLGEIILWQAGENFSQLMMIKGAGYDITDWLAYSTNVLNDVTDYSFIQCLICKCSIMKLYGHLIWLHSLDLHVQGQNSVVEKYKRENTYNIYILGQNYYLL